MYLFETSKGGQRPLLQTRTQQGTPPYVYAANWSPFDPNRRVACFCFCCSLLH